MVDVPALKVRLVAVEKLIAVEPEESVTDEAPSVSVRLLELLDESAVHEHV